ncbi:MAG: hypothetical protein QG661_2869, partial [Actinomycetota bacterium]|nr:hypothetical protein [Actinomycetota bacterium]
MVGTVLVLATWLASVIGIVALGLPLARLAGPGQPLGTVLRSSLWWGLLVAALLILVLNLVVPLRTSTAAWVVVGAVVVLGVLGIARLRRDGRPIGLGVRGRWWVVLVLVAMVLAIGYLAVSALGPVTNYDSGLYHLGAIRYAGEYATIPGLANVYFPFGYGNSVFPVASFLGNGPWDGEGFRLFNGLLIALMAADAALRLLARRHGVGTYVMLVGLVAAWVPLVALADYWVTSPTSDSAVLVLTVVACGYLSDAVAGGRSWLASGAVSFVVSLVLVSMRPLMGFFAATVLLVLVVRAVVVRRRQSQGTGSAVVWTMIALAAVTVAAVQTLRDYLLSGWLQYPLAVLPFDVAWRAPDPSDATRATLGTARDPSGLWSAADGWAWVPSWFGRLPSQWETYAVLALLAAAVGAVVVARVLTGRWLRRAVLLAMVPSAVTVVVWWLATPPSFRFVWGPLFMLACVPLGWALHTVATSSRQPWAARIDPVLSVAVAAAVVVLVGYCT